MRPPRPTIERFLKKLVVSQVNFYNNTACWEWIGYTSRDYAQIMTNGKVIHIHRFIYEYYYGEIEPKLTIDHLCRNRTCANPLHLEQVTCRENILRGVGIAALNSQKTHCPQGHEYTPENIVGIHYHHRQCKRCQRELSRIKYKIHHEKELLRQRIYTEKNRDAINSRRRASYLNNKLKKQQVLL